MPSGSCRLENGQSVSFSKVPCLPFDEFRQEIIDSVQLGIRISSFFGIPDLDRTDEENGSIRLVVVLADDVEKALGVISTKVKKSYPSLTPFCPQVHMFERELAEQWGVVPDGHPWLRPARFQPPLQRKSTDKIPSPINAPLPGVADFFRIQGEEIHEVAVGPVHAGVIEPGHFRFQCHGEKVFHLEISLGYQHRGIERALIGGPHKRTLFQIETTAGDTTVGHTIAYSQAIESLKGCQISQRAQAIRAIGLELERLANHTGDLGALSSDVGFLPTASYCGRIRGDFLNMTALLCGSRLGRGLIRPGGVGFDIDSDERLQKLINALSRAEEDSRVAIELLWDTPAVLSRFENTGVVSRKACHDLGLVGPSARASGSELDVRRDFPLGQYRVTKIPPIPDPKEKTGDVAARAYVRKEEIKNSINFLKELLPQIPSGPALLPDFRNPSNGLPANSLVVSLVEGWRGEICHTAITDSQGRFLLYKIVDPSFHNWIGLGMALRNQEISDFPLCNKSFNLSYCGFDL
ncbi:MAG: NADH-quinone oxidoreductase subunit C [Candidatus Riflebacteria bacterium]|nr:NADH-quinone oxidoreductase subunit C [Candidatus Riflebacteria bacterium]